MRFARSFRTPPAPRTHDGCRNRDSIPVPGSQASRVIRQPLRRAGDDQTCPKGEREPTQCPGGGLVPGQRMFIQLDRLSTDVGPRASQGQGQSWDSVVLEQWSAAICNIVHAGGAHGASGTAQYGDGVHQAGLSESQKVWLVHARARDSLIKARAGPGA